MELADLVSQVDNFDNQSPRETIRLFAWWLHVHAGKELFSPADIRGCFDKLHIDEPPALATYISRMADTKDLLREKSHYKLGRNARADLDKKYSVHHGVVAVDKLLSALPDQVPSLAEKTFLIEAMKCYRVEAFRAAIVMAWNLAFDHLANWIVKDTKRLADFNGAIIRRFPKKTNVAVTKRDDFADLFTEAEVVDICYTANLLTKNTAEMMREKLKRRNAAAHPSTVVIVQHQADDVITDLVHNVVLALN